MNKTLKENIAKILTKAFMVEDHFPLESVIQSLLTLFQEEMEEVNREKKDYVVVNDFDTADNLIKNYKGKSLKRKWVIVAPAGLEEISLGDLLKLPQIKSAVEEAKKEGAREMGKKIKKLAIELAGDIYDGSDWHTGRQAMRDSILDLLSPKPISKE